MSEPVFIGLDLAWSARNPSGLALARWIEGQVRLEEYAHLTPDREILAWVEERAPESALLAIDAPLIAPNPPRTSRPADRALSRAFGRFHAGVYPANRERSARPIRLRLQLEELGFSADPRLPHRRYEAGRIRRQIEFYPHSSLVALFGLPRIIKYKKGTVAERRRGLRRLQRTLSRLAGFEPALAPSGLPRALLESAPGRRAGRELKRLEDELDAVFLSYLAAYYWYWGLERCKLFGELGSGYILTAFADARQLSR
jgi:predicted RNase H-like nuclease